MARPLRIEFAGALYHITSRGNERRDIFFSDDDRLAFLKTLSQVCERFNWLCHAYCLMSNHYHLLIETLDGNLSKGMRQLNGVYTQYVNRTHGRVGHLFQGRYKGILVQKEAYLLELARYIVLNPIRAGMVRKLEKWPWSSYPATAGLVEKPRFLVIDWLFSGFSGDRRAATRAYVHFVAEGKRQPSPWQVLKNQIYLGSDQFVQDMQKRMPLNHSLNDIPKQQTRAPGKPIAYYIDRYKEREKAMAEAYRSGTYSMREIGDFFEVSRMTVSRAVSKQEHS